MGRNGEGQKKRLTATKRTLILRCTTISRAVVSHYHAVTFIKVEFHRDDLTYPTLLSHTNNLVCNLRVILSHSLHYLTSKQF